MTKTKVLFLTCLMASIDLSLFAQTDPEAVYLTKITQFDLTVAGDNLSVVERFSSEKKFERNFEKHNREAVYYSELDPLTAIEALTMIPANGKFKKTEDATITTEDIVQPGIFYGGYQRKNFVFPSLVAGAVGKLRYTRAIKDPHLLSPFFFDDDVPVNLSHVSITHPATVKVHYAIFGDPGKMVQKVTKTSGSTITDIFTATNLPAYKTEPDAPSRAYSSPNLIVYVESFETRKGVQPVNSSVSDLYSWYAKLIHQIPQDNQASLASFVKELTKDATSDTEKTRRVFQWVQKNIRYVAFENGMAGFIPRSSADVYSKRYGDCKDMANLLKDMLTISGVPAFHTWIGTRSKPYRYDEVPSAVVDNHMICAVKDASNGYIFLDATNPFLAYGKPSSMIQNKEALVGISDDKFEVVTVPGVDRSENQRLDSLEVFLDQNGLRGKFKSHLRGFRKDDIESAHLKAQINNEREYVRDFFTIGENNISLSDVRLLGLGDQNDAAHVTFQFEQPGYVKRVSDKIYINLHMNKSLPGEKVTQDRKQLIEGDYRYQDYSYASFTIPEGYKVTYVPEDTEKLWPEFGATVDYEVKGNKVIVKKTIYSDFLYLSHDRFGVWNDFLEALNKIQQQSLTLTKATL